MIPEKAPTECADCGATETVVQHCQYRLCKKTDATDFSTCRYCGTPYGAQAPLPSVPGRSDFDFGKFIQTPKGLFTLLIVGGLFNSFRGDLTMMMIDSCQRQARGTIQTETDNLSRNPQDYEAYIRRGDAQWAEQMYAGPAYKDFSAAIKLYPQRPEAYEKRALMSDAMGNYAAANADRETAAKLKKWFLSR